jgi:hypothetical protein
VALLIMLSVLVSLSGRSEASPLAELKPVGNASLKWAFWSIYDSTLYDPDGVYSGIEPGLALHIEYRRTIRKEQLLAATRDQWQQMSIYREPVSEIWLQEMAAIWPDVRRGDAITLKVTESLAAEFYLNGDLLGRVEDPEFTRDFLAIWLSDRSRFPSLRDQLLGGA